MQRDDTACVYVCMCAKVYEIRVVKITYKNTVQECNTAILQYSTK